MHAHLSGTDARCGRVFSLRDRDPDRQTLVVCLAVLGDPTAWRGNADGNLQFRYNCARNESLKMRVSSERRRVFGTAWGRIFPSFNVDSKSHS